MMTWIGVTDRFSNFGSPFLLFAILGNTAINEGSSRNGNDESDQKGRKEGPGAVPKEIF